MSLFDLQDACIAIGSIATLDLPMVVDLIGIYGLKGPYCTLTTTNWFLQTLSVIPRGSWGDVARRFTMVRWASPEFRLPSSPHTPPAAAAAARLRRKIAFGQFDEENPFLLISSVLLVQADEGVSFLVVDRIGDIYRNLPRRADVIVTTVGARHKCQLNQKLSEQPAAAVCGGAPHLPARMNAHARVLVARWGRACCTAGGCCCAQIVGWTEAGRCDLVRHRARWPIVLRWRLRDLAGRCKRGGATERALAERKAAVSCVDGWASSCVDGARSDISPEELITLNQWRDDEVKARCYVMASMSNEMQRRFEKTKYASAILFHLKELYGENSRHERFTAVKELMTSRMRDAA
ncbi:hypothetical protein F511_18327 [Dorcoceras hygrometricum]|uniref:Acyl-CoA dehydrogenase-related protein n=1 Tax=Dorcoceras hygrometricum TaxID=472368 RepID=A0A2Z7CPL3_9LAMI|nr:hypothetical protein F511_18327 [Dorcoceras hygrometricum]